MLGTNFRVCRRTVVVALMIVLAGAILFKLGGRAPQAQERKNQQSRRNAAMFQGPDSATDDIRSRKMEIVKVPVSRTEDRDLLAKYGRIVADHGSFIVLSKNKTLDLEKLKVEHGKVDTTVNLPGAKFDPVHNPPIDTIRAGSKSLLNERRYYIVQFGAIVKDEWLDDVRAVGGEILQYIPNQAFFVYADSEAIANIAAHPRVRWVGAYSAERKQSRTLKDFAAASKRQKAVFDVAVFSRADLDETADRLSRVT